MTRICVFGAGAVGSYMAAMLAHAGRDVSMVTRGSHLAAIRERGLRIRSASLDLTVELPVSDDIGAFARFDVVVLTAKSPSLPKMAQVLAPHIAETTPVLFATNGVQWFYGDGFAPSGLELDTSRLDPGAKLHSLVGAARSLGLVIRSSNIVEEPGVVFNSGGGAYLLGEALGGWSDRAADLARALSVQGAVFTATGDIRREMWKKLARNTAVALICGLTHASPGVAFSDPETGGMAVSLLREVAAVAAAHGFSDVVDAEAEARTVAGMTAMKPSIVQDLESGRPVELEAQVLIVRDFAHQAGVSVPFIDTLAPVLTQKARLAGCLAS